MSSKERSPFVRGIWIVVIAIAVIAVTVHAIGEFSYLAKKDERTLTDSEIVALMNDLIPKADEVNEIIWGAGLPVSPDAEGILQTQEGAQYRNVADDAKYRTIAEIKAKIGEVYSEDFIKKTINPVAFDGNTDKDEPEVASSTIYPRYKEVKNQNGEVKLNIDITHKVYESKTEFKPETAVFAGNELKKVGLFWQIDKINCKMKATVDGVEREITLAIVDDGNGYRLDEPTY